MRILIAYNGPSTHYLQRWENEHLADREVEQTVVAVSDVLSKAGHKIAKVAVQSDVKSLIRKISLFKPDIVFNLCETIENDSRLEAAVPYLLDWMKIPYTGNSGEILALMNNKTLVKLILKSLNIATPEFAILFSSDQLDEWKIWPAIMKPPREDASIGIDSHSVVYHIDQAKNRFFFLKKRFGTPVLIEEFISGRELNVAILAIGTELAMGINEIDFSGLPAYMPKIVTYEAKWVPESEYYQRTPVKAPALLDLKLKQRISELVKKIFFHFGFSGAVRIDIRLSEDEHPYVLEINPNPSIAPDSGFAKALPEMGLTYSQAIESMVNYATNKKGMVV